MQKPTIEKKIRILFSSQVSKIHLFSDIPILFFFFGKDMYVLSPLIVEDFQYLFDNRP